MLPLLCALLLTVVGLLCIVFYLVCIFATSCVFFYYVCIAVLHTLVAGLLARSQYPEGPATGHLDTGFSWFPCVYKRMLRWFPRLQVATACFSCSSPDLNFLDPYFILMYVHNNNCHRATDHLQVNVLLLLLNLDGFGLMELVQQNPLSQIELHYMYHIVRRPRFVFIRFLQYVSKVKIIKIRVVNANETCTFIA